MHDWFYTTLVAGVVFIASLELMLCGFCYLFFFMGLDEAGDHSAGSNTTVPPTSSVTTYGQAGERCFMIEGG